MVQAMTDGVSGKNGFLLTVPRGRGNGFLSAARTVLGTFGEATLDVTFRRITELGFTEGSLSVLDE